MNDTLMLSTLLAAFGAHYLASEHLVVLNRRRLGTEAQNRHAVQFTVAAGVAWALPCCFAIEIGSTVVEIVVVASLAIALQFVIARRLLMRIRSLAVPACGLSAKRLALRLTLLSAPVWMGAIVCLACGSHFLR